MSFDDKNSVEKDAIENDANLPALVITHDGVSFSYLAILFARAMADNNVVDVVDLLPRLKAIGERLNETDYGSIASIMNFLAGLHDKVCDRQGARRMEPVRSGATENMNTLIASALHTLLNHFN